MEHELLEYIIQKETHTNEMNDVIVGLIKYKSRLLFILKSLLIIQLLSMVLILLIYSETCCITNSLGFSVLIVNVGINLLLFNSIRRRVRQVNQLKSHLLSQSLLCSR